MDEPTRLLSSIEMRDPESVAEPLSFLREDREDVRFESSHAAAITLSQLPGFQEFSLQRPAELSQGMLSSIYRLQQMCSQMTGLDATSLVALSARQAGFVCLAMIRKHFQRNRKAAAQRKRILLCGPFPALQEAAAQAGVELQMIQPSELESVACEEVAALVVAPRIELVDNPRFRADASQLVSMQQQGVLLVEFTAERLWLGASTDVRPDLQVLDLAQFCALDQPCFAINCIQPLQDFLPVPYVGEDQGSYQWQGLQQQPLSIGPLNEGVGALPTLLQCLVRMRLLGFDALQQWSAKSIAAVCTISARLQVAGLLQADADAIASGQVRLKLPSGQAAQTAALQCFDRFVERGARVRYVMLEDGRLELRLDRLAMLSRALLDELASQIESQLSSLFLPET